MIGKLTARLALASIITLSGSFAANAKDNNSSGSNCIMINGEKACKNASGSQNTPVKRDKKQGANCIEVNRQLLCK